MILICIRRNPTQSLTRGARASIARRASFASSRLARQRKVSSKRECFVVWIICQSVGERLKFGSCAEACNKGGEGPSKEMREEKNVEEGGKTECEEERKKGYEGGGGWGSRTWPVQKNGNVKLAEQKMVKREKRKQTVLLFYWIYRTRESKPGV